MTIEEMKARKIELGYTNEKIAELSGVPLGTVQKIFAGETKSPRYDTIQKLTGLLEDEGGVGIYGSKPEMPEQSVGEAAPEYGYDYQVQPVKKNKRSKSKYADYQIPQKKRFGIANGKIELPPDEMFYDDEIAEMFEDI